MIKEGTDIIKEHSKNNLQFDGKLKQINFLDNRVYKREDKVYYPSVTTVLQYMPKNKFFERWLMDVGHNADIIKRRAGKEGTQVHMAVESLLKGEEVEWLNEYGKAKYNQRVWEMINKFYDFWTTYKPELIHLEEFVYSDEHQYAGTADLVCKLDGEVWLLDVKTSNSLHKSHELQLASYAIAMKECKGLEIDRTGIIWLKSQKRKNSPKQGVYQGKGWELKPIDNIEENFELFKLIYRLYRLDYPNIEPIYKQYPTTLKL